VDPFDAKAVRAAYDTVAVDCAAAFADDLHALPIDRSFLDATAERIDGIGPVLDLGCGPGQVAKYLTARGIAVIGLDSATQMLSLAAERTNRAHFACGDMRALPFCSQSLRAVVAFYSIQHLPRSELWIALGEIHRVLTPEGILVVATHLGGGEICIHEFLGHEIEPVGGTFYGEEELRDELVRQSFSVEMSLQRDPLPHEHQSKRVYVMARRVDHLAGRQHPGLLGDGA
jgi:ubiquinone/menaquinone biosynthesis C-methylase UbiE